MALPLTRETAVPRIDEQIAELQREIAMREQVYPGQIRAGKMRQGTADYKMRCIEAALATLQYMRANREVIVPAVKAAREARDAAA